MKVALWLLVALALAGCTTTPPANPTWCPPTEPFHMNGPVDVKVGFGQVWISNATGVYRFVIEPDNDFSRQLCNLEADHV